MRSDMHKIIVERPRHGGGPEKFGRRANVPFELQPARQSMLAAHQDRKHFGENLAPLRRWLRSQVGQPWDLVYGEACEVIRPDSTVRNHIKVHLLEMVERHTFIKDGRVWCYTRGWWHSREIPVEELGGRWSPFYVHPQTRRLCEVPAGQREPSWRDRDAAKRAETCRWLDDTTALLKLRGCWFECEMQPIDQAQGNLTFDRARKSHLSCEHARKAYGKEVVCVSKRQLAHAELRSHGLSNSLAAVA